MEATRADAERAGAGPLFCRQALAKGRQADAVGKMQAVYWCADTGRMAALISGAESHPMTLPTLRIIGFLLGIFLITLAIGMVVPMLTLLAFERTDDLQAFIWASAITGGCGVALVAPGRPANAKLRPRDMYFLTTASWLVVCCFAALPMMLSRHISYTDAFFETMSGITTTGSTILTGLDDASPGLLMWRSMLHWLGGIGFIGMAVASCRCCESVVCACSRRNRQTGREKVVPRSHMAAKYILGIYSLLTLLGFGAFWLAGMTPFDAINHSMSMISTGGFSTSDNSMANWRQPAVHWVAILFMMLGSLPFTLYVATMRGNRKALFKDHQVRGFVGFLVLTWLVFGTWLWANSEHSWMDAFRIVALNVTSVVTTTGVALVTALVGQFLGAAVLLPDLCRRLLRLHRRRPEFLPFPGRLRVAQSQLAAVDPPACGDQAAIQRPQPRRRHCSLADHLLVFLYHHRRPDCLGAGADRSGLGHRPDRRRHRRV
ncbi:hypothetical protein SSTU70S_06271 [Stutzerimonas stutzeri]